MIRLDVQLNDEATKALTAAADRLPWGLQQLLAREAQWAARDMKQELAQQRIAATSLLINSVRADEVSPWEWRVGPHVAYARYVLEGRKPGGKMPPWRAILDWIKVKRIGNDRATAWAIARAIQRRGVQGRDYLTPVAERVNDRLSDAGATVVATAFG